MKDSTKHHYVPRWYQRRFMPDGESRFYYLNRKPLQSVDGRIIAMREIERWGVAKCFQQANLYSIQVPGIPKDVYEKIFFGAYDRDGSDAVQEIASKGSEVQISKRNYLKFIEFLSMQSQRTPKGLDLLKQLAGKGATQRKLLALLASYRFAKCAMWAEGFQEVLYTNSDQIGFLISDHPVTAYNRGSYHGSVECRYPQDPDPSWKGTQTIYPLDSKRCFVLTHTELAHKQSMKLELKKPRTNARMFGQTIAATHQIVHREISDHDVACINQILKLRSRRYIASSVEDWLYPERVCGKVDWPDLGETLLPKTNLWRNTGAIYVGLNNGEVIKRDQFGQAPRNKEEQEKAEKESREMHDLVQKALKNSRKSSE